MLSQRVHPRSHVVISLIFGIFIGLGLGYMSLGGSTCESSVMLPSETSRSGFSNINTENRLNSDVDHLMRRHKSSASISAAQRLTSSKKVKSKSFSASKASSSSLIASSSSSKSVVVAKPAKISAVRTSTELSISSASPIAKSANLQGFGDWQSIRIPFEPFPEPAWRPPSLLAARVVASTAFARFEIHRVKTDSGKIVEDWMWMDERSSINLLVHMKANNTYLFFHQRKYAIDHAAFALVGGLINEGEKPLDAARRELMEETGLEVEDEKTDMVPLGKYRVQANRGGGTLHVFYARNCVPAPPERRLRSDDMERQEAKYLTRDQLKRVLFDGQMGESKWAAAASLGLLYEMSLNQTTTKAASAALASAEPSSSLAATSSPPTDFPPSTENVDENLAVPVEETGEEASVTAQNEFT